LPPDLPRPPRLRRRRGLAAGRISPSSGAATWAGSASLGPTSSWRSVSTDALFAERVGAERPPRDRRLRCPPADRVRAPAPSAEPSAGASRTGGDSRSRSSLPTAAAPGTASSSEGAPRGPVDLVWEEGLRPDRRLRRRRGWEAPVEDSSASGEGPVGPSSRSSSGAVASFICSLNRTSFRASGPRAGASSSCSEAWVRGIRESDARRRKGHQPDWRRSYPPHMTRINVHGDTSSWPRSLLAALRTRSRAGSAGCLPDHAATCHVPGAGSGDISPARQTDPGYIYR
jgi:hypothetical protein